MENIEENVDFLKQQKKAVSRFKSEGLKVSLDALPLKTPSFQASDLTEQLNITAAIFKNGLAKLEKQNGYKYPRKGNNALELTRDDAIEVAKYFDATFVEDLRKTRSSFDVPVVLGHDAKGGIGKSTTTTTLATQASFDMKLKPRTLLIDGDTQGSIRHQLAPRYTNETHTVGSLLTKNLDLSREERLSDAKQSEFREYLLENLIVPTHADDVYLLPSFSDDKVINIYLASSLGSGIPKDVVISAYNDIIISPLKNDFDLIFIDANPAVDMLLYAFYYAANTLIIPVTGRQQDTNAYCEYLDSVEYILRTMMPSDCKGFKNILTLVTKNIKTNKNIYNRSLSLKNATKSFSTIIYESKAYEDASSNNLPIQLMNHTSRNIKDPLQDAKSLYHEVINIVFDEIYEEI